MQYDIIQNNQQLKIDYLHKLCNCMQTVCSMRSMCNMYTICGMFERKCLFVLYS